MARRAHACVAARASLRFHLLALLAALALAGCVPPPVVTPPAPPSAQYRAATFADLPGWNDDAQAKAWPAFRIGCRTLVARPKTRLLWQDVCGKVESVDAADNAAVRRFFEDHFTPYRIVSSDGSDRGLVTGYYEPLLHGSRMRSDAYPAPLFAPPDDLLTVELSDLYPELRGKRVRARVDGRRVVPYWTRADIEAGKADTQGKALVFVSDPVDAFFVQIQGSGRVALDDGSTMRIGYADQNGQPFRSVARVLIDRGELDVGQASMQGIRAWGRAHPEKLPALLDENPSYVFFREIAPPAPGSLDAVIDGPIGSLGVPLLAARTIAVDTRSVPLGAPVYLDTTEPVTGTHEPRRAAPSGESPPHGGSEAAQAASVGGTIRRLVLAQDTGGAIRGPIRADFFWGFGDEAGQQAGRMREQGAMWLLWPNDAPPPGSDAAPGRASN